MVVNFLGLKKTGIYSVGNQISISMTLLADSVNIVWIPKILKKLNSQYTEDDLIIIVKYIILIMITFAIVYFLLYFMTPIIISMIFGSTYYLSIKVCQWLLLGNLFNSFYIILVNFFLFTSNTKYMTYSSVFTLIVVIILNYLLVDKYGIIGAAVATTISFFLKFIFTLLFLQRDFPLPWKKSLLSQNL